MSCCGDKRIQWKRESAIPTTGEKLSLIPTHDEKVYRVFEYVGIQQKKIKGVHTGHIYFFRFPGHRIRVAYEDSFALMGEDDVMLRSNQ